MKVIGITGPSGSGKSKVSSILRDNGYPVIDADEVGHILRPRFVEDIKKIFGDSYVEDGFVNSKKLAHLVFNNRKELNKLNDLMFPVIIEEIKLRIEKFKDKGAEYVFCDTAVLFTSHADQFMDFIILVTASRIARMERLVKFRKVDPVIAMSQVDSVFITHDEIDQCDLILVNENNDELELKIKVFEWLHSLKEGSLNVRKNRTDKANPT